MTDRIATALLAAAIVFGVLLALAVPDPAGEPRSAAEYRKESTR